MKRLITRSISHSKVDRIRSLLFIPGNSEKMMQKVFTMEVLPDALVFDLEDSVHYNHKEEGRKILADFIQNELTQEILENCLIIPRINSDPTMFEEDMRALVEAGCQNKNSSDSGCIITGFAVGKTSCKEDIELCCDIMDTIEEEIMKSESQIKLIPHIETCKGVINAKEICSTRNDRLIGVAYGADDFANDLGITRNTNTDYVEKDLEFSRNIVALTAKAFNLQSFDTPNVNYKNEKSLINECEAVRQYGFSGKFAIHPNQIKTINSTFSISEEEFKEAFSIVKKYEEDVINNNRGSTQVDGRMIDAPVYNRFLKVVELYEIQNKRK